MSLSKLRICVERLSERETQILDAKPGEMVNGRLMSPMDVNVLKAAFMQDKILDNISVLTIGFILPREQTLPTGEKSTSYPMAEWVSIANLERTLQQKGNSKLILDPLEKGIRDAGLSAVEGVKVVITKRIQPLVKFAIRFVDNPQQAMVRISFNKSDGAWSYLGKDVLGNNSPTTMNLGWLDCSVICHEFGHTLGLIHEHQNPDQGIDWNLEKLYEYFSKPPNNWSREMIDKNIVNKYNQNQLNGTKYDPNSIMLYAYPAELTKNNKGTTWNPIFSPVDVEHIMKIYTGRVSPEEFYKKSYGLNITNMSKIGSGDGDVNIGISDEPDKPDEPDEPDEPDVDEPDKPDVDEPDEPDVDEPDTEPETDTDEPTTITKRERSKFSLVNILIFIILSVIVIYGIYQLYVYLSKPSDKSSDKISEKVVEKPKEIKQVVKQPVKQTIKQQKLISKTKGETSTKLQLIEQKLDKYTSYKPRVSRRKSFNDITKVGGDELSSKAIGRSPKRHR